MAHLRGWLKPDYQCGIQSRIREVLLCNALLREQQGQSLMERATVNLHVLPSMENVQDRLGLHNATMHMLGAGLDMIQQQPMARVMAEADPERADTYKKMAEMLKELKGRGVSEMLQKVIDGKT